METTSDIPFEYQPAPQETAEYEAAAVRLLAEMTRLEGRMDSDRVEIERLKTEAQTIKAETAAIKARLQARLDALFSSLLTN